MRSQITENLHSSPFTQNNPLPFPGLIYLCPSVSEDSMSMEHDDVNVSVRKKEAENLSLSAE